MLIKKAKVVLGLAFGDEGKGNTVAYLANKDLGELDGQPLVVRFSGASQATHTAEVGGVNHSFAHFGAGSLTGAHTFWSKFCAFDPLTYYHEYRKLLNNSQVPPLKFFVDPRCPVITPYDIIANQQGQQNLKHGTTGQGYGTTMQRQEDHYKLYVVDLFSPRIWVPKFNAIREYYEKKYPSIIFKDQIEIFETRVAQVLETITLASLESIANKYHSIICEGSQGILLDQDYGFFPNVTRSYTTSRNAQSLLTVSDVYYVMRSYATRHGFGYLPHESLEFTRIDNPNETNKTNTYQGKFRYAPWDPDLILNAIECDKTEHRSESKKHLVITCLDQTSNKVVITADFGKTVSYVTVQDLLKVLGLHFDSVLVCNGADIDNFQVAEVIS